MTTPIETEDLRGADAPCRCHRSHATVSPTHSGHCCFLPATQTCHPAAVATWITEDARWHSGREATP